MRIARKEPIDCSELELSKCLCPECWFVGIYSEMIITKKIDPEIKEADLHLFEHISDPDLLSLKCPLCDFEAYNFHESQWIKRMELSPERFDESNRTMVK
jgi:hypothetical protein